MIRASGTRAPGPLLVLGTGICAVAFTCDHPLVIAALLVGAALLYGVSPSPRWFVPMMALTLGAGVALLNPFVQASGELILFELPDVPIFDTQVTLEEVIAGLALGARAAAVTLTVMAVLALCDPDRLMELAGRLLPRSALAASIAARLVPTLRRDAQALVETSRLRGRSPLSGAFPARARAAGALALPLVGSALDRSIDVAEAMSARGYGSGPRTHRRPPRWRTSDRVVLIAGFALCTLAVAAAFGTVGAYRFFPTMSPLTPADLLVAIAVSGVVVLAAGAARR